MPRLATCRKKANHFLWIEYLLFSGLFVALLLIAWEKNFPYGKPVYSGEFFSDKAAYYIYLPATFIYGFAPQAYPEGIDVKHAGGFVLDTGNGKVVTKVTYGVALLALPFFLVAHTIAILFHLQPDGFSMMYQGMAVVTGIFYLVLGLFLLYRFLCFYVPRWIGLLVPLLLLFSTNLYSYGIDEVFMSHVYSFSLIALLLLLIKRYYQSTNPSFPVYILICITYAWLMLIRPTHVLLIFLFFFLDLHSWNQLKQRIGAVLHWKKILAALIILLLFFLPQMVYWHYLSGEWIYFSYPGEGFIHWKNPMILPFWFSPLNGLFAYAPFTLLFPIGMGAMILRHKPNGLLLLLLFLVYSYLFSSWHSWFFGGSFGCRTMVDFFGLFSLPIAWMIAELVAKRRRILLGILTLFVVGSIWFNQKLFYHKVFYTGGTWSWDLYLDQLDYAGILRFNRKDYTFKNDFENTSMQFGYKQSREHIHSPTLAALLLPEDTVIKVFFRPVAHILRGQIIRSLKTTYWLWHENGCDEPVKLRCLITNPLDSILFDQETGRLSGKATEDSWKEMEGELIFPSGMPDNATLVCYILNPAQKRIFLDDLVIVFTPYSDTAR